MAVKRGLESLKEYSNKFWFLLWKDDSFKGWIFSVIFLFLLVKFVFFPVLSLATGTSLPLAIVESCSMYHKGDLVSNFDSWWTRHENKYEPYTINGINFGMFPFKKGFNKGDILFIIGAKPEKLEVGDVIIFNAGQGNPIIHRVVNITQKDNDYIFSTLGDNNNGQLSVEKAINSEQLVGKASFRLAPMLGWVKLLFYDFRNSAQERGFCNEN